MVTYEIMRWLDRQKRELAKWLDMARPDVARRLDPEHYDHWAVHHLTCTEPRKCLVCGGTRCKAPQGTLAP